MEFALIQGHCISDTESKYKAQTLPTLIWLEGL